MTPSTSESANECMCSAPNRTLETTTATQVGAKRSMSPMRNWRNRRNAGVCRYLTTTESAFSLVIQVASV